MKKILTIFIAFMLLTFGNVFSQSYVQVGNGTLSTSYPTYSVNNYAWYSVIYTQAELGGAKQITKISFDCTNGPKINNNQKIYLKHTSSTLFGDASYENPTSNGYTLVYEGSITYNGVTEITLTTPFNYNGTDNLIVHYENRDGSADYANFNSTSSVVNNNKSCGADNSFPVTPGYLNPYPSSRPNIRFYYPAAVNPATSMFPANNSYRVALETNLSFTLDASATTYDVYFGTTTNPTTKIVDNATAVVGTNTVNFSLLNNGTLLASKTNYYWKVVSKSGANTSSTSEFVFLTQKMYSAQDFPYTQNFTQDVNDPNIVFYPGYYGDLTKTDWTYLSTPSNWSCYSTVTPSVYYGYITPYSLTQGEIYWLTSPRFDLSQGTYQINFDWMNGIVADNGKVAGADEAYFELSIDGGVNWTRIHTFSPATAQNTFQTVVFALQSSNNVRLRWGYSVINSANNPKYFYIDNIQVQAASANPIINLSENSYEFKDLFLNGKTTHNITITNMSAVHQLVVADATATGDFACNVSNLTINPSESAVVTITYQPTTTGSHSGQISFNTNSATGNNVITLNGNTLTNITAFYETFETTTPNTYSIPENWNQISNYPTDLYHFVQVQTDGGTQVLRLYNNSNITDPLIAITHGVTNFDANTLSFFAYSNIENQKIQVGLMDDPYNANSFVPVGEPITLTATMTEYFQTFSPANTKPYIAFKHVGENFGLPTPPPSSIRIDNVMWSNQSAPSVPEPAVVVYPTNTATDIDVMNDLILNWEAGLGEPTGYRISIGTSEANPTNILNNVDLSNATTYIFNNLIFNTTYYWKITPYNNIGNAVNVPVWSFTTMANPTISSFPWTDSFENNPMPTHNSGGYNYRYPMGWSLENNALANICWDKISNTSTSTTNAHTGQQAMNLWAGFSMNTLDDWFFSPPLNLTANTSYKISFWYKVAVYQGSTFEKMDVFIGNENNSQAMQTELFSDNNITIEEYTEFSTYYTPTVSGIQHIGFHGYSNPLQWILFLDDVKVEIVTLSAANDIISFTLPQQTGNAAINNTEKTIDIEVQYGTNITNLAPTIQVSPLAIITPQSGSVQDFSAPVEYTVTAENGNVATWTVTVSVATGNETLESEISLYPNPARSTMMLNISDLQKDCTISIFDITGKMVHSQNITSATTQISVNTFDPGIYFVIINNGFNKVVKKCVIE